MEYAKRNELGSVISISDSELADWVDQQFGRSYRAWMVRLRGARYVDWLAHQLLKTSARILAMSDGSDLFFVGRSAESYFDLLRGQSLPSEPEHPAGGLIGISSGENCGCS